MNNTPSMLKVERNPKMQMAIQRCKSVHPRARRINRNTVQVKGRTGVYTVTLAAPKPGLLLASCNCKAGEAGQLCFHIPASLAVPGTIATDSLQQEGARVPLSPSCGAASVPASPSPRSGFCPKHNEPLLCAYKGAPPCCWRCEREAERIAPRTKSLPRGNTAARIPAAVNRWMSGKAVA